MKRKFILRKILVALSIAFALGGSFIPTNAFASGSALGDGRMASGANADRSVRLLPARARGYERHPWRRRAYEWDPWYHSGSYYGAHGPRGLNFARLERTLPIRPKSVIVGLM
ncbi:MULTISPECIES: hypothetical protein [unclassified Bradyrhizobium]|uniref:hypothetical protein n=1 Tax=unclassified Bradyrhizobium TaxID=2631580 RepID=UPI001FF91E69|nr:MULTISPECIES: hypothetical protein [unclassified Bradyrhizobium]MCK1483871.1 hypothetical protein [Bradyrhizobium sp. 193]MCK1500257.1 hypothetical protein [Bradyrhizobium sp. 188]UPJ84837.1 hypothetical protein IVB17_39600 [Bradyrhizobium sp. 184]UPJ92676.1 hypothetical protein IVB16_39895 [Bradyrhizobium sp. 183]